MPEIVATRALRRRIPDPTTWQAVSCQVMDPRSARDSDLRSGLAVAGVVLILLGAGLWWALQTDSVILSEEAPVWMEMPPPQADPAAAPQPPLPSETNRPSEPEAAPAPLAPAPEAPTNPDPAFGLDDAAETGAMAVASGTTLAKEPEAVVRALEPSAGPVQMASMPASVSPVVPVYPRRAEEAGIEARVVAVVTTDTTGAVVDFRVEQSGGREFDRSVRQAVMATRFLVPRGSDGRARSVAFRLPYDFRLL